MIGSFWRDQPDFPIYILPTTRVPARISGKGFFGKKTKTYRPGKHPNFYKHFPSKQNGASESAW
jgi:hypothetical protein